MSILLLAMLLQAAAAAFLFRPVSVDSWRRPSTRPLSAEEQHRYERDGVLLVKGLLTGRELERAKRAAHRTQRAHWLLSKLNEAAQWDSLELQGWRTRQEFADVAFFSAAPHLAAQAIGRGSDCEVRLLKDAFLAFAPGRRGCGWHIDDHALWPTADDDAGCNVWLSLTRLRAAEGGGLAVVPGSHRSERARQCRDKLGVFGEQPLTCSLASLSPEDHAWMEARGVEYDMEPGDALLLDRATFHRSSPFKTPQPEGTQALRLSIRYAPAAARLVDNHLEPALRPEQRVRHALGARPGDPLSRFGAWYPQVYPRPLPEEASAIGLGQVEPDFGAGHQVECAAHLAAGKLRRALAERLPLPRTGGARAES